MTLILSWLILSLAVWVTATARDRRGMFASEHLLIPPGWWVIVPGQDPPYVPGESRTDGDSVRPARLVASRRDPRRRHR